MINNINNASTINIENLNKKIAMPDNIHIYNAGLVLSNPFLPKLFTMLEFLNEDKRDFKDDALRIRAVFLLQHLVNSRGREYKEQNLTFNRLLVNLPFTSPLPNSLDLTEHEQLMVENMLSVIITNWNNMKDCSVQGLQNSFIEREGILKEQKDKWILDIYERPYDLLLDFLPWNYEFILFPWMKKRIDVLWRNK